MGTRSRGGYKPWARTLTREHRRAQRELIRLFVRRADRYMIKPVLGRVNHARRRRFRRIVPVGSGRRGLPR